MSVNSCLDTLPIMSFISWCCAKVGCCSNCVGHAQYSTRTRRRHSMVRTGDRQYSTAKLQRVLCNISRLSFSNSHTKAIIRTTACRPRILLYRLLNFRQLDRGQTQAVRTVVRAFISVKARDKISYRCALYRACAHVSLCSTDEQYTLYPSADVLSKSSTR